MYVDPAVFVDVALLPAGAAESKDELDMTSVCSALRLLIGLMMIPDCESVSEVAGLLWAVVAASEDEGVLSLSYLLVDDLSLFVVLATVVFERDLVIALVASASRWLVAFTPISDDELVSKPVSETTALSVAVAVTFENEV